MSTHKTIIDQAIVESFLAERFGERVRNLNYIDGGEGSQAFDFTIHDQAFVIRVNTRNLGFLKDRYARDHFSSSVIPIPDIIDIGELDVGYHYALSERVPGKKINDLSESQRHALRSPLLSVLDAIHNTDISTTRGYGNWDEAGEGAFDSWHTFLLSLHDWVYPTGQATLFETSILEAECWERVYEEIGKCAQYCPEERRLLHADYAFDNVFSDGARITGVLDWGESKYGDPIYDGAWLSYWSPNHEFRDIYIEHMMRKETKLEHLPERMHCYELHIGLGALSFYAYSRQDQKYYWNKDRLLKLL